MTEFDGLLPPRVGPPRLPDRGGPAAVAGLARRRRRARAARCATATCVLVAAVGGAVALRPAHDRHGIGVTPAATPPPDRPAPVSASPPAVPFSPKPAPASTVTPRWGGAVVAPPRPATSTPETTVAPPGAPAPTVPAARFTPVDRSVTVDDGSADCYVEDARVSTPLCERFTGPFTFAAGKPVRLHFDYCARAAAATVTFGGRGELHVRLSSGPQPLWDSADDRAGGPHEVRIEAGTCLSYVVHWDGRASDGRALAPGDYTLQAWLWRAGTAEDGPEWDSGYRVTVT